MRGMFTTVPLNAAAGLDAPVIAVMHADPVRIAGSLPLGAAALTMVARRIHAILVCDDHNAPLGWMTARGMLHNAPRDWNGATARDAISEPLASVPPEATVHAALEALLAAGASHVLVRAEERGTVLGVVSDFDLLALLTASESGEPG